MPQTTQGKVLPRPGSQESSGRRLPSALVLTVIVVLAFPLLALTSRTRPEGSPQAAQDVANAWAYDKLDDLEYDPSSQFGENAGRTADETQRIVAGLTPARRDHPARVAPVGEPVREGEDVLRQTLRVTWDLGQGRPWEYDTLLTLRRRDGDWRPVWQPSLVHPQLAPGLVLTASRLRPTREQVIGAGERVLMANQAVVDVGIRPGETNDRRRDTAEQVARLLGLDVDALVGRVVDARDEDLVPVTTRPVDDCRACARLRRMPGVVLTQRTSQAAVPRGGAPHLLGGVTVADETLRRLDPGRIAVGDLVGVSGLERTYDSWLAGSAGVEVRAVPAPGSAVRPPVQPLHTSPPVPGRPLRVTIDDRTQAAAEAAVVSGRSTATVVAVDVQSGDVLAVATGRAQDETDHGLGGRRAPGWPFTLASTLALLSAGRGPQTPVECPPIYDLHGQRYTVAEGTTSSTLQDAVVRGCGTALASLAGDVTSQQLADAAARLGYGRPDPLGTPAFRGSVPVTADDVQHTSQVLGEGQVLASPLAVARASATVAGGRYVPSRLVLSPEQATPPGGEAGPPLPDEALFALQDAMRRSVTDTGGTAHDLAAIPGDVAALAGTASYGPTGGAAHQVWCTGYRSDLAFAVLIENTTGGVTEATDVAAELLSALPDR